MGLKKKDLSLALLALFPGLSAVTAASAIVAYQAIFPRYERPNYSLLAGEYLYDRIADRLSRREIIYQPHDYKLKGYFYESSGGAGTVILRHGIHAGADDYLPLTEQLVLRGYSVFTYDATGTYESEGESTVGMCQAIIDLEATVKYLRTQDEFKNEPFYFLGHSWGAYAVTAALNVCEGIRACAAVSGMNNGVNMISDKVREYVKLGSVVDFPETVFRVYQKLLFGRYVDYDAVSGINKANIPTLIAHGVDDRVILLDSQSIASHASELKNGSVEYYIGKGLNGEHDSIWHSSAAVAYQLELASEERLLEMKKRSKLTDAERAEFYSTVDHRLYSEVNGELLDKIISTFKS